MVMSLLPYMWRAWWRKTKQRGVWHGANTAMVTVIAFLSMLAVLAMSLLALRAYRTGDADQAGFLVEFSLNAILLTWLIVPVMVGASTAEGRGLQPVRLGQFPFSLNQLLGIGLLGRLVQPIYWILIGGSAVVLLPLSASPTPATGMAAGALFLLLACLLAWSVELFGSAIFSSRHGREILMLVALLLLIPLMILLNSDYDYVDGNLFVQTLGREYLIIDQSGTTGLLVNTRAFSPSVMVSEAARGQGLARSLVVLGAGVLLMAWLARVSLRRVLLNPPSSVRGGGGRVRGIGSWSWLPADVGPLVVKEVRYLSRTLDHLMGMGLGLIGMVWVLVKPEHLPWVLPLGMMNLVFNESAIPLNIFGLDGRGHDRYRLLPLDGTRVLWSKNLAYFLLVALQISPLVLAGVIAGEPGIAVACLLGTVAVCFVTAAMGNYTSVKSPAPRAFFNFDSKEQTGGGLTLLLAGLLWVPPALVYVGLKWISIWYAAVALAVVAVIGWFIYRATLGGAARRFEIEAEAMRDKLSVE